MCKIQYEIEKFLIENKLANIGKVFILGFSGGEDSSCLLHVLKELREKLKFSLIVAHLNHNWRGEQSFKEQQNCAQKAHQLGLSFYTETLPNNLKCAEAVAREERYKFFERCAKKFNTNIVFTAHSKTDNAETLFQRIINGTGIDGLKGIPAQRTKNGITYFRPMLALSRNEIKEYNKQHSLLLNFDSSNLDTKYTRNNIRENIFPLLAQIAPDVENALNNLCEIAKQELEIIDEYFDLLKSQILINNNEYNEKFFNLSESAAKRFIYLLIKEIKDNYDKKEVERIYNFVQMSKELSNGKFYSLTKDYFLFVSKNGIKLINQMPYLKKSEVMIEKEGIYTLNGQVLCIEKIKNFDGELIKKSASTEIYVDLSKTEFPLTFKTRTTDTVAAEFIQPFGMNGKMKLKKYFINRTVSRLIRNEILILYKDNEVLWIPTVGMSEKLRVTNKPTHKIIVRKLEKNCNENDCGN